MSQNVFTILFLCFFTFSFCSSQTAVDKAVEALVNDPGMKHGSFSFCLIDVESGKEIAGYNSQKSLIPASSLKVVTTATALEILGSDYRFKTNLEYDGELNNGVLEGNLYIKGFGDPTLGSPDFEAADNLETILTKFYRAIKTAGIEEIRGQVVGDGSYFDYAANGRTWIWEDLGNYYGAGAFGLNIHENLFFIKFQQESKLGATPPIAIIEPDIPNLLLFNELQSAKKGSGDNAYIFNGPQSYTGYIRGTIPVGNKLFTIKGAIPDPPFMTAHLLLNFMKEKGVVINGWATTQQELEREGITTNDRKIIYTHQSPTLNTIIKKTNLKSVNLYCEAMLRAIGKEQNGNHNAKSGIAYIQEHWKRKGVSTNGWFLEDGSGLSPRNSVSTYQLAIILQKVAKTPDLFQSD